MKADDKVFNTHTQTETFNFHILINNEKDRKSTHRHNNC